MATTSKARKATKRTTPRKAAGARTRAGSNGQNGHAPAAEGFNATPLSAQRPVEPPQIKHPYGELPVHVYQPRDGSDPIVFPKISTVAVTAKFMWKIYNLAEIFQSFEWMNLADVPREIQERVVDLPPLERQDFWSGWFADVTQPIDLSRENMGPPGES